MPVRAILAAAIGLVFAALFTSLGLWQVRRHLERRDFNRLVASRVDSLPVPLASLPADTAAARFRRVRVAGRYDWANEILLAGRTRNGSPGVYLLTPLRPAGGDAAGGDTVGGDTAVLVYRGWVYSPDATRIDPARWREAADTAAVDGFVLPFPTAPREGSPAVAGEPRTLRWLEPSAVRSLVPYPIAPYTVVALGDSIAPDRPARLEIPPLEPGPHRSYAFQWFSFAAIALAGGALLVRHELRRGR